MKPAGKLLAAGLLCAGLVCVNYLASQLPFRADATAGGAFTLSPGTRSILQKIEEPVVLDFYYSRDAEGLPVSYKNYAARVGEMLRHYARSSGGKLRLNLIHPQPDTPEEERAAAAGLQPQIVPVTGEPVYLGLVATQADQQKTLPILNPRRESLLEYDLTSLIHAVQQIDKPRLGLITSLPLQGQSFTPMMGGRPRPGQLALTQWEQTYEIVTVGSSATELPADLDALAIIHPQGVGQPLQFAIDQFLLSDRPVFLALDPASAHFKNQGGQQAMFGGLPANQSSDLPVLLKGWGIDYDPQNVVGDPLHATPVNTGRGVARMPVWLSLNADNLATDAPATAQLGSLLFIEPGSFTVKGRDGRTVTPLARTSDQAGTVPNYTLQFAEPNALASQLIGSGQKTLAALVTGSFASAFPNGPPKPKKSDDDDSDQPAEPAAAASPLKEGRGTLLLVADTDWLLDDYSVRRGNFLGNEFAEPLNDNLALAANALDALAGSSDLVSLRGKTSSQRPFTVVNAMEAAAQQRYQAELDALEQRLLSVQSKLNELVGQSAEGNRIVATPEMQKTIDEFREQEAAMRRERRDIRRSLREGIDRLEHTLLAINLIAPAVAIAAFGLWFRSHRRRHAA